MKETTTLRYLPVARPLGEKNRSNEAARFNSQGELQTQVLIISPKSRASLKTN